MSTKATWSSPDPNSTLGITFIDGTVFGLSSNAKMVLNEMVYDPNGSNNSSLLSLVAGTISFVAGETAKHGDMKIDTPVATMGIRGTAVLVEIDFDVPARAARPMPNSRFWSNRTAPPVPIFCSTRTRLLRSRRSTRPGSRSTSATAIVSYLDTARCRPDVQKLITEVFAQKFTDNTNQHQNVRSFYRYTDSRWRCTPIILANGTTVTPMCSSTGDSRPAVRRLQVQAGRSNLRPAHRSGADGRHLRRARQSNAPA